MDSRAGGINGRTTADVMSDAATVDCNRDAGLEACAEKCRTAFWVTVEAAMAGNDIFD